jgi:dUTP pyrophosphatase
MKMISVSEADLARLLQENVQLSEHVTELQAFGTELVLKMRALVSYEVEVPIKTDHELPRYQTDGSAGMDLVSTTNQHLVVGARCRLPTGVRVEIPPGYVGKVVSRSGLAMKGIIVIDGTIDSDFRGEVNVIVHNIGHEAVQVHAGLRVAQLLVMPVVRAKLVRVEGMTKTERGDGGFGSTG